MFLVNSRSPLVSATLAPSPRRGFKAQAPLLPKLRGHFAEFLNHDSLVRLGILCPTTCVGLGYGRLAPSRRGFSRHPRITLLSPTNVRSPSRLTPVIKDSHPGFTWRTGCALERTKPSGPPGYHCASPLLTRLPTCTEDPQTPPPQPHRQANLTHAANMVAGRGLAPARQHGRCFAGTGISTRHPSTTPVGLALGPDSPREDEPAPGTLGLSAPGTLTPVSLLMPAFSLPRGPPTGHPRASPRAGRSPTTRTRGVRVRGFGGALEPR